MRKTFPEVHALYCRKLITTVWDVEFELSTRKADIVRSAEKKQKQVLFTSLDTH